VLAVATLIHAALAHKGLLPQLHIVDTGYLDAKLLVTSRHDYAVELCGPTRHDWRWQAQAGQGFAAADFVIDWDQQHATCPGGKRSISWTPAIDGRENDVIKIKFSTKDCGPCQVRPHCTQSRRSRRSITIRPKAQYQALQEARTRARTQEYTHEQWRREGIEGILSYGIRGCGLRRSRYRGLARTHVQHVLTATAMNLLRLSRCFAGEARAPTRQAPVKCRPYVALP
jgi:transposase